MRGIDAGWPPLGTFPPFPNHLLNVRTWMEQTFEAFFLTWAQPDLKGDFQTLLRGHGKRTFA